MSNEQPICPEHGARWIRNGVCVFDGFGFSEICGHVCAMETSEPTMPQFTSAVCRGDFRLRTACGKCERCKWIQKHQPAASEPAVEAAPTLDPETDAADGWEIDAARRIVKTNKGTLAESLWQGEINNIAAIIREAHGSRVADLEDALRTIRDRRFAAEYHDGSSTRPDAIRELQAIAARVLEAHAACAKGEGE